MMKIIKNIVADFTFEGKLYTLTCPYKVLDRNYDDESYAYFLKRIPKTRFGLFEINILKDEVSGAMLEQGYVSVYPDMDDVMPDRLVDAKIMFT